MLYKYSPYTDTLRYTRILYAALLILFIAAMLYATGVLTVFEDGSFILCLGGLDLSGCINPLALCAR